MNEIKKIVVTGLLTGYAGIAWAESDLQSIFENGSVSGNLRVYDFSRNYDTKLDASAFALGGALNAETGALDGITVGVGYYSANDLDLNDADPQKVDSRLGDNLEVLGEAYVKWSGDNTLLTLGRQKINSPMVNASDAFIIPLTYEGFSIENKSISGLDLNFNYINEFKNRNSDTFVDVGIWSTQRYKLAQSVNTAGTLNLGAVYAAGPLKLETWLTRFSDLFDSYYLQGHYDFSPAGAFKPFIGAQFIHQQESGDALLSKVDSNLYGLQLGAAFAKATVTFNYNAVQQNQDAFYKGAFLAPYSFSTTPVFTNNMLQTMENTDSGSAYKLAFKYGFSKNLVFNLSYSDFSFDTAPDRNAVYFDLGYNFDNKLKGLSLKWRLEKDSSDVKSVNILENRLQLQIVF